MAQDQSGNGRSKEHYLVSAIDVGASLIRFDSSVTDLDRLSKDNTMPVYLSKAGGIRTTYWTRL